MRFPPHFLKTAEEMIQNALLPQAEEPADVPQQREPLQGSVLSLLGHDDEDRSTTTEPAPKVVMGRRVIGRRMAGEEAS